MARLTGDMKQATAIVSNATAQISRAAGAARSALEAMGLGLGAASLIAMTKGAIDAADKLNDLTQSLGMNIAALAQYQLAAAQGGTSLEAIGKGIKGLSTAFAEHGEALRQAGIDATTQDGRMRQLADVFASMPDGIEKTTLAVKFFGKSGMELIPMLNQGAAGLDAAAEKSAKYAAIMGVMAPRADAFNDSMAELTLALKVSSLAMVNDALPALTNISKAMAIAAHETGSMQAAWVGLGGIGWEFIFKPLQVLINGITIDLEELNAKMLRFLGQTKAAEEVEAGIARMYKEIANLTRDPPAEAAAKPFDTAKWTADYEKLLGALGVGKEKIKKGVDEIAAHNKRMRDLDNKGWVAYIEAMAKEYEDGLAAQRKIDEESNAERLKLDAAFFAEKERLRKLDEAGWIAYVEATTSEYEAGLLAIHAATKSNIQISDEAKKALTEYLDPAKAKSFGDALSSAFGSAGSALGKLINSLEDYGQKMAEIEKMRATNAQINDPAIRAANETRLAEQSANAQISAYGDMAAAAKGFFETGSSGYKALEAAEKVFRAFELASAIQTMLTKSGLLATFTGLFVASKATETAATVASVAPDVAASMAKGQAAALTGVANQAQGDPYSAWVRMAAMAAVMVGLGFAVSGSFSGGSGGQTAAQRQREQGTGTVLGDADAKSQSLLNAIKEIEKTDKLGLTYSHDMLEALRAIQSSMGALASLIFRTSGVTTGGDFGVQTGTLSRNTGDPLLGMLGINDSFLTRLDPILGGFVSALQGLWGKTTQEITDAGVLISGTVGQLMRGQGISQYANVTTNTSSWFGLVNDTSNSTLTAGVSDRLSQQFALIFGSIIDSIEAAARALDMWSPRFAEDLRNFVVEIDRISLQGLQGQDLQDALNSVFSTFADKVSLAFFGTGEMQDLAKAGEGFYETLIRVATGNEYVKQTFAALGLDLPLVGMAAVTARMELIDLAGGLEAFGKITQDYYSKYYSPAEQYANTGANLGAEFNRFGVAMPTDPAGMRALIESIGTATPEARALTIELMKLAGVFYDYSTAVLGLDGQMHTLDETTRQHRDLQEELDVLNGTKTAQFVERSHRMAEAIDNTSLATLQAIFAEEDRQAGLANQARQNEARFDLERQLFDLSHSEAEILEHNRSLRMTELALKEQELGMAPGTLQAIQAQIDAQTDLNAARLAEAEALKHTSDLEGRLGVLRGDFTQQELDRAREWQGAANDTDRALLSQIYAQEDLAEATRRTTEALDRAKSSQQSMWERFATDAQKAERATQIVNDGFAALGIAVPQSGEAFANLVAGIDAATPAGQALLAALELIAPSFATITSAALTMVGALYGATPAGAPPPGAIWVTLPDGTGYWMVPPGAGGADGSDAANLAKQRRQMEIELQRALGNDEIALMMERADQLAALDVSLRGLQQQIWDALDAKKLREAAEAWANTLNDWLNGIALDSNLSPLTAQQQLLEAQRQYDLAKLGGDAGALTAAADALLAADKAVEGFGGGYSALYAQIMADISGLAESGPVATVGEAQIVTAVGELRKEVADAKVETARLLERLIEATRDGTEKVSSAVNTGTTKTASATEKAAAVNERK